MSKALAGVAKTRLKAIKVQRESLAKRDQALLEEQTELEQLVAAYETPAPDTAEGIDSAEAEELV